MKWYFDAFKQYAVFQGRASRTAFWMFFFVNLMVTACLIALEVMLDNPGYIDGLYSLISFIPFIAIMARRLHDAGLSAGWLCIVLVPAVGILILVYFLLLPSAPRSLLLNGGQAS